ncbi:hypothetical protein [Pseudoalteromonas carrageenovora]|uniref:hypothetical protein n=1 Tax=Pseudoalteromonas carrageenovora TaxID=227 RepID=UPI0026E28218|nr:hypothetical protein [Pseudoalteromonas carrageenovora]MDO6465969.1 hypothetical protein [Pseudoalteromonas carrageenovora]
MNGTITITTPYLSQLRYISPLIKNVLETVEETYIKNTKIPCCLLPTSGREISITPLFYHAAFEAYSEKKISYIPSAEIQVNRGNKKGRLDLALIGKKHIELIELKATRVKLFGNISTIINKIRGKLNDASIQLGQIEQDEILQSTELELEGLAIVTVFLLVPSAGADNAELIHTKVKELMSEIKATFTYAIRASLIYSYHHQINLDSSKGKDERSIGMITVASRKEDIDQM